MSEGITGTASDDESLSGKATERKRNKAAVNPIVTQENEKD